MALPAVLLSNYLYCWIRTGAWSVVEDGDRILYFTAVVLADNLDHGRVQKPSISPP